MKAQTFTKTIENYLEAQQLSSLFDEKSINAMRLLQFEPNDYIFHEGNNVDYLYLLLEGKAKVSPSSSDGRLALIDFIIPMDFIGDMEYFSNDHYHHSVVAITRCIFIAIPTRNLDKLFQTNVQFYRLLCSSLASKMKRTSIQYSNALLYPLKNRIAKYLLDLSIHQSSNTVSLSYKETAEYFGISPRHFRRILKGFEDQKAIRRNNTSIDILNIHELETIATYQ